jgi:hypothetical protein
MNPTQPGPNLTAVLNAAHTVNGDLRAVLDRTVHEVVETLFVEAVRDDVLHDWHRAHAGMSLVAYLAGDGTVAACHEMPSREAEAVACEQPDRTFIIATWPVTK